MDAEKKLLNEPVAQSYRGHAMLVTATMVTTALVILSLLGGLYVLQGQQPNCQLTGDSQLNYNEHYTKQRGDLTIEIDVKLDSQVERFINKDMRGHIESMAVVDYLKRIVSIYSPAEEKCYLIPGIDLMGSFDGNLNYFRKGKDNATQDLLLQYRLADPEPVRDRTLLPADFREFCAVTSVFWLQKDSDMNDRFKRQAREIKVHVDKESGDITITIKQ